MIKKLVLILLVFLSLITYHLSLVSPSLADVTVGAQIPSEKTIKRLIPSQYTFGWLKFQYSLGSTQSLETWISSANSRSYNVLISVAKNLAGIEKLTNPPYSPPLSCPDGGFSQQYCPWDEELEKEKITCKKNCTITILPDGTPQETDCEYYTLTAKPKTDNGYTKFRDTMMALAPRLKNVGAVEIWNEPNLAVEWTNQGLGPVNPENYANFLACGVKGLKKGDFAGKIISAALSPNAPNDGKNMNDLDFFNAFIKAGGANKVDALGWHSNVTSDIPPEDASSNGFQRVKNAFGKGKPVWITEFGWDRSTFTYADDIENRKVQAQYVSQAVQYTRNNFKEVEAMFIWNFGFATDDPSHPEFVPWDIEGTSPKGSLCQPNPKIENPKKRGDTRYVQDKSLTDDYLLSSIAAKALVPEAVNLDAKEQVAGISKTQINVTKGFIDTIASVLASIIPASVFSCEPIRIPFIDIELPVILCMPNISVGKEEIEDSNKSVPGKNIQQFSSQAKVLGKFSIPSGMELIPEQEDCNLNLLTDLTKTKGKEKMDDLSNSLGTTTGFYGNDVPNFKNLAPEDWEASMEGRILDENLNIGNKIFAYDKRSPDIYLRKMVMCKGFYPNGICPFEPSPTPTVTPTP